MSKDKKYRKHANNKQEKKIILITGVAGFIGANLAYSLLSKTEDIQIVGIDNMNDYYDIGLKQHRLKQIDKIVKDNNWIFYEGDISDELFLKSIFKRCTPRVVVNLAAQAGVRYSIENPNAYIQSNLVGFSNVLECCRHDNKLEHLIFASSSSVYGGRKNVPFRETDNVDAPISLYAATKKSDELLAHSYSKLYNIPSTGLRFFTVYGPMGRPDMAYYSFTDKLVNGEKINIFNYGKCERDFTYIDDIVEGIIKVMDRPPAKITGEDGLPMPPYEIYNIGNSHPENLMDFVKTLSEELVRAKVLDKDFDLKEQLNLVPMQLGDVAITYADTSKLERDFGFKPETDLRIGLRKFAEWYREYYSI